MKRSKVRFGLIVLEVALTLAIVANCVALIREAHAKINHPSGFDDANLIRVSSIPFEAAFKEDGYLDNTLRSDLELLASTPGVRTVSNTNFLPWAGGGSSDEMRAQGSKGELLRTQVYNADERTFEALGTPVTEGRGFTRDEVQDATLRFRALGSSTRARGADGQPVEKFAVDVVISRAYGRLAFGEGSPLGKVLEDSDGDEYRVIGVIDAFYNPYGWPIHDYVVFYPTWARSFDFGSPFLVRAEPGQGDTLIKAMEHQLLAANNGRNLRIMRVPTVKNQTMGAQRITATLMAWVAVLLVLVTAVGIVGLTSFSVTERTRQIGTRRALGARRRDVLRHFLAENWLLTTMGIVLGTLLAFGINVALVSGIEGAKLRWPLLAGGVLLLWATGLLATLAPAFRATRISPAIATRNV
jgi:putative ABC transport system permease protein